MRIPTAILLTILLGTAAGVGSAVLELQIWRWDGDPGGKANANEVPPLPGDSELLPKVTVDHTEHDFGTMDVEAESSHDFVLRNLGRGNLKLTVGGTSCGCTVAKLEKEEIPPGGSSKVTLKWHSRGDIGPFNESAKIRTNDPMRPGVKLTVKGQITVAVRAVPSQLIFSRMSPSESATAEFALYCYLDEPLEILGYDLSRPGTAGNFELTFLPLAAELLAEEPQARSGSLVRVTVKPGLPLGAFRQRILLKTNLVAVSSVDVPLAGMVGKEITIVGPRWDESHGVVTLGTVNSREGGRWKGWLVARGLDHKEVQFKPVEIIPDLLRVTLGESISNEKTTRTPLIIEIPKGSRRANHLGSQQGRLGRITIETNRADVPRIDVRVRFAVEG